MTTLSSKVNTDTADVSEGKNLSGNREEILKRVSVWLEVRSKNAKHSEILYVYIVSKC